MTEEIRPICLYVETCLDKKEGTRDCAKCEHHLNYWTELMIRDMEKNITRLEQENKQMKSVLEEIRDLCTHYENTNDKCVMNCYAHFIVTDLIQDKINECLGE